MKRLLTTLVLVSWLTSCNVKQAPRKACATPPHCHRPSEGRSAFRTMNVITFSQHAILWNWQSVTDSTLRKLLSKAGAMNPAPVIVLDAAHAPDCLSITQLQVKIDNIADCK